jgi:hypothetical protein
MSIANFPDGILPGPLLGIPGDPMNPVNGLMWYSAFQQSLRFREATGTQGFVGLLKASVVDSTISSTNVETAFSDGFFLFPGNSLAAGKCFRISVGGVYTSAATPGTIRFNWRYGPLNTSPNISSTNNMTMTASQTGTVWGATFYMTVRSIGVTGSALGSGMIVLGNSTGNDGVSFGAATSAASVIDTTAMTPMTLFCTFSLTTASITMNSFIFEALN